MDLDKFIEENNLIKTRPFDVLLNEIKEVNNKPPEEITDEDLERVNKAIEEIQYEVGLKVRRKIWKPTEEHIQKIIKARCKRPSNLEKRFTKFCKNNNLPYKYVGNGEVIIGRKCPDFININGEKKIIELYGSYWHAGQDPQERIDHYKKYGFNCIVIWDWEFKNMNNVLQKVLNF